MSFFLPQHSANHYLLQGGVPVNARTCKHLKELLGDKYEAACVKLKNLDGPPPKGAKAAPKAKAKSAPKAKATKAKAAPAKAGLKRKKHGDDDDDDAQEGDKDKEDKDEDIKPPPSKRGRKAAAPAKTAKGEGKEDEGEDEDDREEGDDKEVPVGKSVPELLLANKWDLDTGLDPTGWWVSEKLNGVRYALPSALLLRIR